MRTSWILLCLGLLLAARPGWAGEDADPLETARKSLEAAQPLPVAQESYATHISRSQQISAGLATLTGEAINPLFGVTIRSVYEWWQAPSAERPLLPWYYQPRGWVPLIIILLLMVFKGTICEAAPFAKKPLDALGDMISKAGAVFSLPIVLAMFADSFTLPATQGLTAAWHWLAPVACAAEAGGGAEETFFHLLGWLVSVTLGTAIYVIVWLAFNTIDVLILISPFPAVDAALKSFRLAVMGGVLALKEYSPTGGLVFAILLVLACSLIAGWSLRLSWFGFIYSTDILLFRARRLKSVGAAIRAFANRGVREDVPMRTYGTLTRTEAEELLCTYRPWLVLPLRELRLPDPPARYDAGVGLINPYVVRPEGTDGFETCFRLPPRYKGHETEVASALGLGGVRDTSVLRGLRALGRFLRECFTGEAAL